MADPMSSAVSQVQGDYPNTKDGGATVDVEKTQPPSESPGGDYSDRPTEGHLERWNQSRSNIYRFFFTLYGFGIMGMNDAVLGALIPYIETHYDISYTVVSLLFLAPFVGYVSAGLLNNIIHHKFGQFGVAVIAPTCRILGYIALALHPPYAALPIVALLPGFGNGLEDSAWNAWVGHMHQANELLGVLHGAYGMGGTIAPLIASAMITKAHLEWYAFYYIMVGMSGLELVTGIWAFWGANGAAHREATRATAGQGRTTTRRVLREPITWVLAFFLLFYVGAEVSLGGWVVTFMLRVRHADPFLAGITVTLFWLGITLGRLILGFVTGRVGEKLAITAYLALCVVLELLYWFVPHFAAAAVFIVFLGFFLGPLFPAAVIVATKVLPKDYHVSAIGFAASFGGGGAAVLPFAVGAIAQKKGVEVLQPIILAVLVVLILLWLLLPGGMKRGDLERAGRNREGLGSEFVRGYRWLRGRFERR
ncbi:related to tetracycline resistance proteins [Cephalotrichum gorgonifer]|uniref:Related to tetracycline resistance proteins n=1 Tax=Cephalotrichum gorgonifer TaxID=2041049 RepID=A0AAE8SYI5_9PEZI|nr:related to tetracycline resistance proteins [Cephalotrichum gorgonifer]